MFDAEDLRISLLGYIWRRFSFACQAYYSILTSNERRKSFGKCFTRHILYKSHIWQNVIISYIIHYARIERVKSDI